MILSRLILGLFLVIGSVTAATIPAISPAYSDVLSAYNSCSAGDTLSIPPGEATWTNEQLTITKRIQIVGSGAQSTIIRRGTNTGYIFLFNALGVGNSTNLFGAANMTIDASGSSAQGMIAAGGNFSQTNGYFRFSGLLITNIAIRGIRTIGASTWGVIDHCTFHLPYNLSGQGVSIEGFQRAGSEVTNNANSTSSYTLGTANNFVYVEDCKFDYAYDNDSTIEMYWDAHAVFRFNQIMNGSMGVHENGASRAATIWEFYGNTLTSTNGSGVVNWLTLRSGWGVVWSNTITSSVTGFDGFSRLTYYRAAGTNVYAANLAGNIQSYPLSVTGTNKIDGNLNSSPDTIGYPAFDMPGWGDPTVWTTTNSQHTFHGVYSWSNTLNGAMTGVAPKNFCNYTLLPVEASNNCNYGLVSFNGIDPVPDCKLLLQEGRDYFNETTKPGYVPLVYPHPLVSGGATETQTIRATLSGQQTWNNVRFGN